MTILLLWLATTPAPGSPAAPPPVVQDSACVIARRGPAGGGRGAGADLRLESLRFSVAGWPVNVCYSRPRSSSGRPVIGSSQVPYGEVWRTGESTPAVLHTAGPITIAGVAVPPGSYLLFTVPGEAEWQVVVNRAVTQWADGPRYDATTRSAEVGRVRLPVERLSPFKEQLTLRAVAAGPHVILFLEWEQVQLAIPISPG